MGQAVRFDASADKYTRSASGLNTSTSITTACWVKLATDRNSYGIFVGTDDAGSNYLYMGVAGNGTLLGRDSTTNAGNVSVDITIGSWWYIAIVNDIASTNYHMRSSTGGPPLTAQVLGGYPTGQLDTNTFYLGNSGFGDWINGSLAQVKVWTAALTQAELEAEMVLDGVARTANLWGYWSFRNGPQTNDESGQGRTLTAGGTLTADASGPPVTIPPSGLFVDDFNRADTTPTQSAGVGLNGVYTDWDAPQWQIASNKATRIGSSGTDYATFATTLGSPDHYAEADYDAATGSSYCVVNVRRPSAANVDTGYLGYVDPGGGACHIAKVVAGTFSSISGGDFSAGAPYPTTGRIRLEALGSLLTLKINGVFAGSVTDSTITTGNYAGINGSANAILDNFAVGTFPTPTMSLTPTRSTVTLA